MVVFDAQHWNIEKEFFQFYKKKKKKNTPIVCDFPIPEAERVQFSGPPLISDYEYEFRIINDLTLKLLT